MAQGSEIQDQPLLSFKIVTNVLVIIELRLPDIETLLNDIEIDEPDVTTH
jgi:hypothetical protein